METKDGLGEIYEKIERGECVCDGFRASCPVHATITTSIYSPSITKKLKEEKTE